MQLNLNEKILLNKFIPRAYQIPIMDAFENKKYTRGLLVWP